MITYVKKKNVSLRTIKVHTKMKMITYVKKKNVSLRTIKVHTKMKMIEVTKFSGPDYMYLVSAN